MKNLKSKLRLSLCLLTVCFSTFAQTDSHDCEIVVTRADLEKCATYKRQNELLEKEIKFQAVETVSLKDTIKARNESILAYQKLLKETQENLDSYKRVTIYEAIVILIMTLLIIFGPKLLSKISIFVFFSSVGFAQIPDYRPPFTLNGQKGLNQKILYDTTANKFSIESANDVHTFNIPYTKLFINPGNQFQYYRGDKTWQTLNKDAVGLNNIDNTSDINKPISTATLNALNLKQAKIDGYTGYDETNNGHVLTSDFGTISWRKLSVSDLTDFSSHNHTLDGLSNVAISAKATGDLLKWNGTAWSNFAPNYFLTTGGTLTGALILQWSIRTGGTGNSDDNTFFGKNALISRTSGNYNTGFGASVLSSVTTGAYNSVYGRNAGASITTGQYNTFIGQGTGSGITTGSYNTIIGSQISSLSSSTSNNIVIADGQGNQRIRIDATGNAGFGTTTPSYKVDVSGTLRASGAVNLANYTNGLLKVDGSGNVSTDNNSYAPVTKFNNVTITDSSSFTHSLGTQRISVAFFEAGYKEITILDWYPDTTNTIKVYLPYRDKPTKYKFVGDVFITKRY